MPAAEPSPPEDIPPHPLTRERVEVIISRTIGWLGFVFAVLAFPALLNQAAGMSQPIGWTVAGTVLACLAWGAWAVTVQRAVTAVMCVFPVIYLLALVLWPQTVADGPLTHQDPWLWPLCAVATACAAVGMPFAPAAVYTVLTPVLFAVVIGEASGGERWADAALDAVYAAILGGILLVIMRLVRQASSAVDAAQQAALASYAVGVRAHAEEAERIEVDSIVHDSVLTTLLSAAKAEGAQQQRLAAEMAAAALGHLSTAQIGAVPGVATDVAHLASRLAEAARKAGAPVAFSTTGPLDTPLPASADEALYGAAVQAVVNSVRHAGGQELVRELRVAGSADGVTITVRDDGIGFDPGSVAAGRLGIAVSITGRLHVAGGLAELSSAPDAGTTVVLRWPAPGADTRDAASAAPGRAAPRSRART